MARLGDRRGDLRIRLLAARLDELGRDHPAAPAHVADDLVLLLERDQSPLHDLLDALRLGVEVEFLHGLDRAERRGARDGVAAVRTAEAAGVRGVHDLGAPCHRGEREAAGDALGGRDQVGDDALVLAREPLARTAEAGLDLVGDEDDAVLCRELAQRRQEALRRLDEAALAEHGLDDDGGDVVRADLLRDLVDGLRGGLGAGVLRTGRPAVRVRDGYAVDLGREGAEALLVRHVLGRQRHREVGPAVVAVVEDDDRLALRVRAGDLDSVLDGLGTRVEERGLLRVVTGGERGELLGDGDVALVRRHHETRVREVGELRARTPYDGLGARADGGDRDAGAEVDEAVAVDVLQDAALGARREHGQRRADAGRDGGGAAGLDFLRLRAGDGRDDAALLRNGAHEGSCGPWVSVVRVVLTRLPGSGAGTCDVRPPGRGCGAPSPTVLPLVAGACSQARGRRGATGCAVREKWDVSVVLGGAGECSR
ncbi:putative 4-aminobutyrate transaminase [Streptomyces sp. Tu6071]|nr:putative 4-aminobutyrate transaminase [Streptomyces sp. Tu6071]